MARPSLFITFILIKIVSCLDSAPEFLNRGGRLIKCDQSQDVDLRNFFPASKKIDNITCYCLKGYIRCKPRAQDEEQPVEPKDQNSKTAPSIAAADQDQQEATTSFTECDCEYEELEQDAATDYESTTDYVDESELITHPVASHAKDELQRLDLHGRLHIISPRKRYVKHDSDEIQDDNQEEVERESMLIVALVIELLVLLSITCLVTHFRDRHW